MCLSLGWIPWARHPGHLPRASVREGGTVRDHLAPRRSELEDHGRDDQQCRDLLQVGFFIILCVWRGWGVVLPDHLAIMPHDSQRNN